MVRRLIRLMICRTPCVITIAPTHIPKLGDHNCRHRISPLSILWLQVVAGGRQRSELIKYVTSEWSTDNSVDFIGVSWTAISKGVRNRDLSGVSHILRERENGRNLTYVTKTLLSSISFWYIFTYKFQKLTLTSLCRVPFHYMLC